MRTLVEHVLLLEYDHDKTWQKHGETVSDKLNQEVFQDGGHEWWRDRQPPPRPDLDDESDEWREHVIDHRMDNLPSDDYNKAKFHDLLTVGDPTPHKEYSQWISRTYANDGIRHSEDIPSRVRPALEAFHDAKRRKLLQRHGVNPDINQHKSLSDLEDAVEKLPKREPEDKDRPKPEEYSRAEDEHWTRYTPHTQNAACYYGRGSRWCTAATQGHNMFHNYNRSGPLQVMVPKQAKYPGEKYQYHLATGSFMDEKDRNARPNEIFNDRPSRVFNKDVSDAVSRGEIRDPLKVLRWSNDHELHARMANDPNPHTRSIVARETPHHDIVDHLADDSKAMVRATAASRTRNPHLIDDLMNDGPEVREGLAGNDNLTRDQHLKLLDTGATDHIARMVAHKSDDPVVHRKIVTSPHLRAGHSAVLNKTQDPEILRDVVHGSNENQKRDLVMRFHQRADRGTTLHPVEQALIQHGGPDIRGFMAAHNDKDRYSEHLMHDESPITRYMVADKTWNRKVLEHLSNDPVKEVREKAHQSMQNVKYKWEE